jgi:Trp operon repressor
MALNEHPALRDLPRTQRGRRMKTATNRTEAINNRKQTSPIKVFCTPDERQAIIEKAKQCGLSVSYYLRAIALGLSSTRINDFNQTDELIKTKVELGRILSLLRLCLTLAENFPLESRPRFRETVTDVIQEVEDNQASLKAIIQRAVK